VRKGVVKNITDFGAFIDLGGMDGLLHITDMSWGRVGHPSEVVGIGDELEVKVLDIDWERERLSLGLKQLQEYPWKDVDGSTRWAPASAAAWSRSPTTAPSWSWRRASRGWSTSAR
jgi:ribosomal protein S1